MPRVITLQYALDPTPAQEEAFKSHAGAVRFVYNWALARIEKNWEDINKGLTTEYVDSSMIGLRRVWNKEKHEIAPWYK